MAQKAKKKKKATSRAAKERPTNEPSSKSTKSNSGKKPIGEVLRKLWASGVSPAFMSEENLKNYLGDIPLPKEVMSQVLGNAKKSRDELVGKAGAELTKLIRKIDLSAEFRKILLENKIKVHAEIDFVPKESEAGSGVDPSKPQGFGKETEL